MPMFGQLNPSMTIQVMQSKLAALRAAFEDCENIYEWLSAYSLTDLEDAPLNLPAEDAQGVMNAFADAHQLWMTAQGSAGFPAASLPYNFMASQRMIVGAK